MEADKVRPRDGVSERDWLCLAAKYRTKWNIVSKWDKHSKC